MKSGIHEESFRKALVLGLFIAIALFLEKIKDQRSKDKGQRTKNKDQRSKNKGQKSKNKGQRTKIRRPRKDDHLTSHHSMPSLLIAGFSGCSRQREKESASRSCRALDPDATSMCCNEPLRNRKTQP